MLDMEERHVVAVAANDLDTALTVGPFLVLVHEALEVLQGYRLLSIVIEIEILHSHRLPFPTHALRVRSQNSSRLKSNPLLS